MNLLKTIDYIVNLNINNKYIILIFLTILTLGIGRLIIHFLKKQLIRINNNRVKYKVLQFVKIIINISEFLIIYLLWENNIKNVITLISFISAAITLSLKDIIFNLFAGVYIKINKPFKLEDRIEIDGNKGDVINIGTFTFELLETNEEYGNQSTGIVLTIPNSHIFAHPIKNLNKGFKYIWDEININLALDSNVIESKKVLYKIINNIDLIKVIPTKMKNELKNNTTYRMYFNKYDPVIYTEVNDNHIVLKLRYLVNPKKARIVESYIWNEILKEYKNNNIQLLNK